MCYDAVEAQALLAKSVDRIHFDEAWYGYARFNPMYRDRYAMRGDPATHPKDGPTVFATHSTHKFLAALSQTSFIHIRDGRGAIDHGRFNEAYCSQASTSPLYALIASNDVAAAMMDGPGGQALTQDVIDEAVACRLAVARISAGIPGEEGLVLRAVERRGDRDPKTGKRFRFTRHRPNGSRRTRPAGFCIPARPGMASTTSRTVGACSTRPRSASSVRA